MRYRLAKLLPIEDHNYFADQERAVAAELAEDYLTQRAESGEFVLLDTVKGRVVNQLFVVTRVEVQTR